MKYAQDFLKIKNIDDACKTVRGELPEVSTDLATYWYGNKEVVVLPADDSEESFTMFVDTYGTKKYLLEG